MRRSAANALSQFPFRIHLFKPAPSAEAVLFSFVQGYLGGKRKLFGQHFLLVGEFVPGLYLR